MHEWKFMQHLEICLLTDLPTTGGYFSFHLTFKIIVFLSGSYRHKMEYNCCRVSISVRGKCRKGFIHACLYGSSCWILRRTTGETFLTFQSFNLCVLPVAAKKWNTAAIKILLLFEPSVICYLVWSRKASQRDFNESDGWACMILQQSRGKGFLLHLIAFRSYIQG